ncbi:MULTISPECIES: hypothetical protein [Ralstonia solanacearum species complex]|uniref:hypothetical protein n=1 Tax=Ralstonia solanacearum species complex TaxID=3116862 RepID=UPI0018D1C957|nr:MULTISPECIES: hypothetical protein [Ralstonia solanacearum species complex]
MSILETFYILFDSDAKDVKKGAENAEKATGQLEKKIKAADMTSTKLGMSFKSLIGMATGAIAGALSVGALVSGVARAVADADALGKSSEALRVEVDTLHAWSEAAERSGGSGEEFRKTLTGLNDKVSELAKTGKGEIGPLLQRLGVRFRDLNGNVKTTPQLLLDVAKSFERLSKTESAELGRKMGLDEATIALLQKGRQAVEEQIKRQKELGVVNKADAEAAKQYTEQLGKAKVALGDLGQVFQHMFTTVATTVLPVLTWLLKKFEAFTTYLADHSDLVKGCFIGLALVLTAMYLPAVLSAAAATLALLAPYLLIGAAIAAVGALFALAYEDVMAFLDGNDSLIGELAKRWPIIGEIVHGVADVLSFLFDLVKAGLTFITDLIDDPEKAFERFSANVRAAFDKLLNKIPALKPVMTMIGDVFDMVGGTITAAWNGIGAAIEAVIGIASRGIKIISGAIDKVKAFFGMSNGGQSSASPEQAESRKEVEQAVAAGKQAIATTASPIAAQTSTSITQANRSVSKNIDVQTGPITIHAKEADGNAVNQALSRGLSQELSTTLNHFDDGVAA